MEGDRYLRPTSDDVIFDLGAGLGRVICVSSRLRIKRCVGVELLPELAKIATINSQCVRGKRSPIDVLCGDASFVDLSCGTIFFFFNPFGAATMERVLENIYRSKFKSKKSVRLVYINPTEAGIFARTDWLEKEADLTMAAGLPVFIYRSVN